MKNILLSLFIITYLGAGITSAQSSLSLSHDDKSLGDTVTVWIDPSTTNYLDYTMAIHNNSDNGMNVKVARKILKPLADMQFTFCLGTICYGPGVDSCAAGHYLFVSGGGASAEEEFKASYTTMDIIGTAIVRYNVYNKDNPADSVSVVIKFWVSPTGIEEDVMKGGYMSEVYPNPATNSISLDYQLTSKVNSADIKIFNVLGSTVKEAILKRNGDNLKMDVSDLENGIYFYSVLLNGEIYTTKKLIIRK
jgi:hypothetical protein